MAERLSQELFNEFLWQRTGTANVNWSCETPEHGLKTHPSDVVFYYDEPYSSIRTFINCDLKSYGVGSINGGSVRKAIDDLAKSLRCAEKSQEWQAKYIHKGVISEIVGLLFIFNHDGVYDKNFASLLASVRHEKLDIPKGSKIFVLGPADVFWLNNVSYEITHLRGKSELPPQDECRFYYPHLVQKKNIQLDHAKAATLEMLTGPWITLTYNDAKSPGKKKFLIFYRRRGDKEEEFMYLIDYFMNYQMLDETSEIHVKALDADINSNAIFDRAISAYVEECEGSPDIKQRLSSIKYSRMNKVHQVFSEDEIGMDDK